MVALDFPIDLAFFELVYFHQVVKHVDWQKAMTAEYEALIRNDTWTLMSLPPDHKVIGCKWVIKIKLKPDDSLKKYKAQLIAKGFQQTLGLDFFETFSPVVKPITIQIVLSLTISL